MTTFDAPSADELAAALHDTLALVAMELLPDGGPLPGLPGTWSRRPDGAPGARVQLPPGEQLLVDGVATGGTVDIDPHDPAAPGSGRVALDAGHRVLVWLFADAAGGEIWVGLTSESAPRLRAFRGVTTYPDDDRWRLPVSFTPAGEDERVSAIRRIRDGDEQHGMVRAGWFSTTIDGREYRLSVDRSNGYSYVNFRDAGSGTESYGAGRLVRLAPDPADVDVLDLNEAVVPPCGFNPLINCPLPPPGNVVHTVVRAGQRDVLFDPMP